MSQNNGPWFRCYCDIYRNPKLRMLPEIYQLRYLWMLALYKDSETLVKQNETLAYALRLTEDEVDETLKVLKKAKLLTQNNAPTGWKERQFESDTSTLRVRKHRTLLKRSRNVTETPSESDSESDSESETYSETETVSPADKPPAAAVDASTNQKPEADREAPYLRWLAEAKAALPAGTARIVVDTYDREIRSALNLYYERRGGRLTPTRIGEIGRALSKAGPAENGLLAIEVFVDNHAGDKDHKYLIGIIRRLSKLSENDYDSELHKHRSRHNGSGLWHSIVSGEQHA